MDNYSRILDSVLLYEQKQENICRFLLILLVSILVFVIASKWKKHSISDKYVLFAIETVFVVILILHTVFTIENYKNIKSDKESNDYILYSGEIFHDDYQKDSFYHNVYIESSTGNSKVRLKYPDYANHHKTYLNSETMPNGAFQGSVTYSAKSKIIVNWEID